MSQINSFEEFEFEINKAVNHWKMDFNSSDVTKVNLSLLGRVFVDYFGDRTAVKYLGSIKKGTEGEFYFTPFVPKMIQNIYQAIVNYGLNWKLSLQKDTIVIFQPLITSEKKSLIVRDWKLKAEHCHIKVRKIRHDFLDYWKHQEKLSKDDLVQKQRMIQKIVDQANKQINNFLEEQISFLLKV